MVLRDRPPGPLRIVVYGRSFAYVELGRHRAGTEALPEGSDTQALGLNGEQEFLSLV